MTTNNYVKLAEINVSEHIEKKAGLSYLSWPWAVDQLMRSDPAANWTFNEPQMFGDSMMVSCTVTAFGKPITMHLPVMDHRNKAISNPNAFDVNKNMMRCLVKAIACHGLGLYIYAGEDLPQGEDNGKPEPGALTKKQIADITALADEVGVPIKKIVSAYGTERLEDIQAQAYETIIHKLNAARKSA